MLQGQTWSQSDPGPITDPQVLASPKQRSLLADSLPDDLPGQSNCGAADASSASFPEPARAAAASALEPPSDWHQPEASGTCASSSTPAGKELLPCAHWSRWQPWPNGLAD
jgi:hypothetical protein